MKIWAKVILLFAIIYDVSAQENTIILPNKPDWNIVNEGQTLSFKLNSLNPSTRFNIKQGKILGMTLDSLGNFSWKPSFDFVSKKEKAKLVQLTLEGVGNKGEISNNSIEIKVNDVNRPPKVNELSPFFIKYNTHNVYKINRNEVFDEDNDPIVFIPNLETLPEGMTMSMDGEIDYTPSSAQFRKIAEKPYYIEFYVEDQPNQAQEKGRIKLETTQMDLAPIITYIPKSDYFKIRENESINIRFYLSDPNGDSDIAIFDFIANQKIDKKNLVKLSNSQYEFSWTPGYDFVQDPLDSLSFDLDFFAIDNTQKKEVKTIKITVLNTVNEAETDKKNYNLYMGTLKRAWELIEQLIEKENELKKAYNKARKGKKSRSVITASLGAGTGLSSLLTKSSAQRTISTVGGTTTLTIGTLEATEVIGRSMKDLIDRLNYVIEKKNEIQTKGDIFARDFSLKSTRRNANFIRSVDDFMAIMNLKGLVALELNATWQSKNKFSVEALEKTFKDFEPMKND